MYSRLGASARAVPVILAAVTLFSVAMLLAWDAFPRLFPRHAHNYLGAFPLAMIAVAYLVYQAIHRPPLKEVLKALMLAVAFLLWAANQLWPELPAATLFNDLAIALFVLDVFLVIAGWPSSSLDESFAESYPASGQENR